MEKRIPGYCALCISRCGCISIINNEILTAVEPFPEHPTGKSICIKGKAAPEMVYSPERILTPLKRTHPKDSDDPCWQAISWDEALDTITTTLQKITQDSGAEAVTFGVTTPSGTGISDSFVWINRLAHAFGSPNTLFATENCNWHKDFAPKLTHGDSIGMPDYEKTSCILLWGFNPSTSWLAQAELVNHAIKRGAKLIVIDPRKTGFANRANEWLRVRPAADGPLAMALAYQFIINGWYDKQFIHDWSNGPLLVREDTGELLTADSLNPDYSTHNYLAWDSSHQNIVIYDSQNGEYQSKHGHLALLGTISIETSTGKIPCKPAFQIYTDACSDYTPKKAEALTDIPAQQIIDTARLINESGPLSYFTWTGTAQQSQATQTGRAIALLYALTGHIDAPGGNVYFNKPPIANLFGMELLTKEQRAKTLGLKQRPLGPGTMGWITSYDLYKSVVDKKPYGTKALVSFGGNPLLTKPNADDAGKALAQLEFYVHADLFLNPTANYADIILPVSSPWERSGLYPGFQVSQQADTLMQLRPKIISPLGQSQSDNWIVFELAKRLGLAEHFFGGDIDTALKQLIEPAGLSTDELKNHPEGVTLPLKMHYRKYQKQGFTTPSRKLEIFSKQFQQAGYAPVPQFKEENPVNASYPLRLTSAKWIVYCHSQQRHLPSLRKRMPEPLVEINPQTAAARDIEEHDWVIIETIDGAIQARAKYNNSLAKDVVCSQYGWWTNSHRYAHNNYNNIISDTDFDPISSSNTLRNFRCNIRAI